MYSNKSFAAIIPARSGSVSVKNKNLQKISGKSLFQITLDLAKKSKFIDQNKHIIFSSGHPSPLSANRGYWFGNKHFSKANQYLKENNITEIKWM